MTKRLKYTKDILTHMLNNNQQQQNPSSRGAAQIGGADPTGRSLGSEATTGMSSNSSRRGQPISGIAGMNNGTPISGGEPMNGFGLNSQSIGSSNNNGLQTVSSIG